MSLEGSGSSPFADILPTIRCPRDCHLFEADLLEMTNCPFLHRAEAGYETAPKLPPFACVDHLLGSCTNQVSAIGEFNKCLQGFHLTLEELVDLEHFSEKMAEVILSGETDSHNSRPAKRPRLSASENSQEESPDCGICLEPITGNFGLLANCTHPFCAECLISWFGTSTSTRNCPVCRQRSPFLLNWPTLVTSTEEKQRICQLQQQAAQITKILDRSMPTSAGTSANSGLQEAIAFFNTDPHIALRSILRTANANIPRPTPRRPRTARPRPVAGAVVAAAEAAAAEAAVAPPQERVRSNQQASETQSPPPPPPSSPSSSGLDAASDDIPLLVARITRSRRLN